MILKMPDPAAHEACFPKLDLLRLPVTASLPFDRLWFHAPSLRKLELVIDENSWNDDDFAPLQRQDDRELFVRDPWRLSLFVHQFQGTRTGWRPIQWNARRGWNKASGPGPRIGVGCSGKLTTGRSLNSMDCGLSRAVIRSMAGFLMLLMTRTGLLDIQRADLTRGRNWGDRDRQGCRYRGSKMMRRTELAQRAGNELIA